VENKTISKKSLERWKIDDSVDLYGINNWGAGYFDISGKGEVVVHPSGRQDKRAVSLMDIISGIKDRGLGMPVLLRFGDILQSRVTKLHESFHHFIKEYGYQGIYRGVYPIKVNQQQQVVEEVTRFGSRYHHGLEAGSKAELLAAISLLRDPDACLICNGYKDEEFVDLGLYACKMGLKCFFPATDQRHSEAGWCLIQKYCDHLLIRSSAPLHGLIFLFEHQSGVLC